MTVLLADEIKRLCDVEDKSEAMIDPFHPSRLRPASYRLTLGDEAHVGGEHKRLDYSEGITLEPHQVAIVCTRETLRIPRDIIARWSLRVGSIYEGLLWTGGPQVDPGWEGKLFCPIYNLAERTITLKYGDPLFTIDFVHTTGMTPELEDLKKDPNYDEIWFKPQRRTLQEHDIYRIHSAPYEALRNLQELTEFRRFAIALFALMFTAIAAVITALSVIVVRPVTPTNGELLSGWPITALSISIFALAISIFSIGLQVSSKVSIRLKRH